MARWKIWTGVTPCPYCKKYLVFEVIGNKRLRGATKEEKAEYKLSVSATSEKKGFNARTREKAEGKGDD